MALFNNTSNRPTYLTSEVIPLSEEGCLVTYGVICFLGVIFNTITIIIIIYGEKFGKSIKLQLLNLAIADLLSAILVPTWSYLTYCVTSSYPNNSVLCKTHRYVIFTVLFGSLLGNAFIAAERFVAVYFPLKILRYEQKHVVWVIVIMWISSFILQADMARYSQLEVSPYREHALICVLEPNQTTSGILLVTSIHAIKYLLPTFVIILAYGLICIKLKTNPKIGETHKQINKKVSLYNASSF